MQYYSSSKWIDRSRDSKAKILVVMFVGPILLAKILFHRIMQSCSSKNNDESCSPRLWLEKYGGQRSDVIIEVCTLTTMNMAFLWVVTPCSLVCRPQRFGTSRRLHRNAKCKLNSSWGQRQHVHACLSEESSFCYNGVHLPWTICVRCPFFTTARWAVGFERNLFVDVPWPTAWNESVLLDW